MKEMEGVTESQGIPTDWTRPAVPNFAGDRIQFSIPEAVYTGLKRVSKQNNVSLFTTLLSLYSIIISKYSNQNDIVVGTPFSGREHKDVEDMIGMFVNVLPIRTQLTESIKFEKLLQQVQEKVVLLQECQIYPFEQLVQNLNVERGINKNPIFTTVFSYRNSDQKDSTEVNFGDSRIKPIYYENPVSKFDLSLNVLEINSALFLEMEYAIALYKKETVQKIFDVFIELSTQVIQNMQLKINELSVLLPQDKTVNESINESLERSIDDQTTFLDLFENMCEQLPEQPALIHKNRKLTYEELNSEANKWAKHLVKIGIKKGRPYCYLYHCHL
ncbi:condensation domain-containing protein [Bacillus cereus]